MTEAGHLGDGGGVAVRSSPCLHTAILETVAYADVFGWPLTSGEVHRNLPVLASAADVAEALHGVALAGLITTTGGVHAMTGREHLVAERRRRMALSQRMWPHAVRYGKALARIPWVRMVAVTGSLAVDAASDDADVDYFIVTDDGQILWLSRTLTVALVKLVRRPVLCPNYLITESALALDERDVYTAHELAQLVPLSGAGTYGRLLRSNAWYRTFLPNHPGYTGIIDPPGRAAAPRSRPGGAVARLEAWAMRRGVTRLGGRGPRHETRFDASVCKGHFDAHRHRFWDAYEARRRALGVDIMSRVLIGQSYFLRFDPKLQQAMQPYAPLGSLYAASYLRGLGHDVSVFDAMLANSEAEWDDSLARTRPEVAVLFEDSFNYLSKMCLLRMREAARSMIGMAAAAGCTTVVCGSDATDNPMTYLDAGATFVIKGEGEVTLGHLLDRLPAGDGTSPRDVAGLAFRDAGGGMVTTSPRATLRDLDALPFPDRDFVAVDRYRDVWERHGRFSMNMATTRGCPFHCNWCAKPIWGQRYAVRSAAGVVAELTELRARHGPGHISFVDDIFGLKPGWTRSYADLVREHGVVTPFKCLSRADLLLRDGEVEALRDAGCETVWIGAESGSQKILDAMEKGTTVEQIHAAAARLRAAGIRRGFFLQFGYPGEGPEEVEATRRLVRECDPDDIGISVSYPLPGTRFHQRVLEGLGERRNWVDSSDLSMLYRGPFSTRYYRRLHRVIHKEFRLRRAAGTVSPLTHVGRVAAQASRERLGRVRDAVTLPVEQALLGVQQRRELRHPPARP